ncbi:hypothetical protein E2C01_035791 [Portunus trituberculatus]|uniref:Uncharacterized protein n=1 Tax=Portunus trituberculatus TaxID=210409 RepID=A0A5B7F9E3_PORTR|nr:hypothetical protein [Portunus trituberculatus]
MIYENNPDERAQDLSITEGGGDSDPTKPTHPPTPPRTGHPNPAREPGPLRYRMPPPLPQTFGTGHGREEAGRKYEEEAPQRLSHHLSAIAQSLLCSLNKNIIVIATFQRRLITARMMAAL